MSLRIRLVLCLGCVLAVTLTLGCLLAGWRAIGSVRTEMLSALAVGRQAAANGIDEIANAKPDAADETMRQLRHLVATFDHNRHLRAALIGETGETEASSTLAHRARPIPAWFVAAMDPRLPDARLALPAGRPGAIVLRADPANEAGEVWDQAIDGLRTLAIFVALTALLLHWALGRALRPLARLSTALGLIGAGDYATRLDTRGPPELARLSAGFNRMAAQLGQAEAQNRRLREQLLTLQDEERAELARDLHDEIGPFLFAAAVDAAGAREILHTAQAPAAVERIEAISESVSHMQRHIRSILGRLRPLSFGAVGLAEGIGNLVAFWRSRHPDIAFGLHVADPDATLSEAARATICRVVQESLCNAVRHGHPARIDIAVTREAGEWVVSVTDDGIGAGAQGVSAGFGLVGMRERVQAHSGSLAIRDGAGGRGLAVTARLPCEAAA
jgi:two-component system sensor histidine kinase UhpB